MAIAGVGLMGASLGLAVRKRSLADEVVGFGRGEENLRTAKERGALDRYELEPGRAAEGADLVVLAVPVGAMQPLAAAMVPRAARDAVVIDVGSVKRCVVEVLEPLVPPPAAFVGCHPIAGTEQSGAAHASERLLEGRWCILTPTDRTDARALGRVRELWEAVGMRVDLMGAEDHDRLLALVSHLPHVVAWALVGAIESERVDGRDPLAYSGGGLRDTTRIAASQAGMWRDILLANRAEVLRAIERLDGALGRLRRAIEDGDGAALEAELERLRIARERLNSP
jgi:prephenate dehydrogenase